MIHLNAPILITRVILSSFTVDSTLTLTGLAAGKQGSCINGNYLYISLYNDKFHKINLNTFTLKSTLTTTTGYFFGCSVTTTGTYLIACGIAAPIGAITYIDLATFTEYGIYRLSITTSVTTVAIDGTFIYFGFTDGTISRKYIQPTTRADSRLIDNINTNVSSTSTDLTTLQADVGDASASTQGSLYGIVGNPAAGQDLATRIGYEGATSLANKLTAARAGYLDLLLTTDNNYSSTGNINFTSEQTVLEIAVDIRYKIVSPWIDITSFTATATITFQFYRSVAAAGATYRKAGDAITKVVGTDNPIIEFADWAHYGYTKITAVSNNAADTAVNVLFGYIKKPLE